MASYVLVITGPDRKAQTLELTRSSAIIGREVGDVVVNDPRCSGRHAEILFDGQTVRVNDLGSTNGTFCNGQRISQMTWKQGVSLQIGKHQLTLQNVRDSTGGGLTLVAGESVFAEGLAAAQARAGSRVKRLARTLGQRIRTAPHWAWAAAALVASALAVAVVGWFQGWYQITTLHAATMQQGQEMTIKVVTVTVREGAGVGDYVNARVRVSPNESASVAVGISEQYARSAGDQWRSATWLAAFNASRAIGAPLSRHEFNVAVTGHIDGPSAGMLMTVAMLALMNNHDLLPGTTITGSINPDGTAGPVGGIVQKLSGAQKAHLTRFGFPVGLRHHSRLAKPKSDDDNVDVVVAGQELGIEAREIADIHEAYEFATGVQLPRLEPVAEAELAFDIPTRELLRAKVEEWKQQVKRQQSELNEASNSQADRVTDRPNLEAAERFEKNDYPSVALEEYAEAAINLALRTVSARLYRLIKNGNYKQVAEMLATERGISQELEAFRLQLEVKAATQTRAGQLNTAYAFKGYAVAFAALDLARELDVITNEAARAGLDDQQIFFRTAHAVLYYALAREYLKYARILQDVFLDEMGSVPFSAADLEPFVASYASAATAVLASFDALALASDQQNTLHDAREKWKAENYDYALAEKTCRLAELAVDDQSPGKKLLRLSAAGHAFLEGASLLNRWSLAFAPSLATESLKIDRRRTLSVQLDLARRNALEAAARAKQAVHFIPTAARVAYQTASARRDSNEDTDKLVALKSYWESAFWSELASTR